MSKTKLHIDIIASTKPQYKVPLEDTLILGGKSAGICYLEGDRDIFNEEKEKTLKRVDLTLNNGHHSVYEHSSISLHIQNLPKILSIFLVSEKQYSASIKSGRYTRMDRVSSKEKKLYDKWIGIFEKRIGGVYPKIPERLLNKLAMENARYLTSIFTPTQGIYTFNIRQLNYIVNWFREYIESNISKSDYFTTNLISSMKEFIECTKEYHVDGMVSGKERGLSLFKKEYISYKGYFNDTYSTNYFGSFVQLEQVLRHRTLEYTVLSDLTKVPKKFFIPPILDTELKGEWLSDLDSIMDIYPNAGMIKINERGSVENFILKCYERLCGNAQLETMLQTKKTLKKYISNTDGILQEELSKYMSTCCMYTGKVCKTPCIWGSKRGIERRV